MGGDPYFFLNGLLLLIDIYVLWENKKNLSSGSLIFFVTLTVWIPLFELSFFAVGQFQIRFPGLNFTKKMEKLGIIYTTDALLQNVIKIVSLRLLIFDVFNKNPCKPCWITVRQFQN